MSRVHWVMVTGAAAVVLAGCGSNSPADRLGPGTARLPGDVVDVRLTTSQSVFPDGGTPPPPATVTVTGAAAQRLVHDLNALASEPITTRSCPTGYPFVTMVLRFPTRTRTFQEDRNCADVIDAAVATPRTELIDSDQLQADLRNALPAGAVDPPAGLLGDTSPPVSPPPTPAAFPTQVPTGGLHSAAAAQQVADALVAGVPVPPGAVLQSGAPPAALVPGTTAAVETKADALRWYVVPGPRDRAVAWLEQQKPGGFFLGEYQKIGGPAPADNYPRILSIGSENTARQPMGDVQVTVLKDGDHTDVRVSAEVIWTPLKPAIELIPDAVKTGVLVYHRDRTFSGLPEIDKQITLTAAQVDRLRRLLNPMRPVAPGESSCPEAPDEATLTFRYSGRLVLFKADLGGCGFITISVDGTEEPYLRGGYALAGPVRTMVGLPATPPT